MNKGLAFLVLVSSCVSAFCLSMLAITYATGSLPFNIQPEKKAVKKELTMDELNDQPGPKQRLGESILLDLYKRLERQEKYIAAEREKISQEKDIIQQQQDGIKKAQKELDDQKNKLIQRIEDIQKDEIRRMTKLATLIGGMDVADAKTMLMAFDDEMACKILYLMKPKTASKIIAEVIKSKNKKDVDRIKKIADDMSKLNEDLTNDE